MNVYIENITKNIDVSIRQKILKPGSGDVFSGEVSKQDGVVAFARKGWLKIEMVKESPNGVVAGVVPEHPRSGDTQEHDRAHVRKKKTTAQTA